MNKLSLRMKLKVASGVLFAILITMGVVSYFSMRKLTELSDTVDLRGEKQLLAADVRSSFDSEKVYLGGFLLTGSEQERNRFQESARRLMDTMGTLEQLLATEEDRRLFGKMQHATEQYNSIVQRVYDLRSAGKTKEAVDLFFSAEATAARDEADQSVPDFMDYQGRINTADRTQQAVSEARSMVWIAGLAAGGLLIGLPLATLLGRSVAGSVSRMVAMIQEVAANNLAVEDMKVDSEDELGKAATALNSMKNNLSTMMQSIASTAEHVAGASEEISASATQTATGADTQKDQVHQIATAMQEMAATVHEVSENSNQAADSARQAADTARHGGAVVDETLAHMHSIAESVCESAQKVQELGSRSDQIGKIVGVIDDIADQTNLLALNAAIEAARAGEQGRGFAVVADEVRKLAERTTKATKEIAEMIEKVLTETRAAVEKMQSGTEQVEKGVEVTGRAGESLKQIIGQAEHVGEMVTHIATAATEQSSAAEQISSNIEQINKLVAESAEGAQQSAKACEQLSNLAFELQSLVSRFKLASGTEHRQNSSRSHHRDRPVGFDALPALQPAHAGTPPLSPGAARGSAGIDFSSARTKHNAWKTKLHAVLDGRLAMSESEAGSPRDCQVGQWLYGTGLAAYGHIFEMHELESAHSQMHASVREVLRAFHAGDRELAQREFQRVSELSSQVVTLLTKIEKQAAADPIRARAAVASAVRLPVQRVREYTEAE